MITTENPKIGGAILAVMNIVHWGLGYFPRIVSFFKGATEVIQGMTTWLSFIVIVFTIYGFYVKYIKEKKTK